MNSKKKKKMGGGELKTVNNSKGEGKWTIVSVICLLVLAGLAEEAEESANWMHSQWKWEAEEWECQKQNFRIKRILFLYYTFFSVCDMKIVTWGMLKLLDRLKIMRYI